MCPAIRFGRFRRLEHQISWPYTGKIGIKTACRHGKSWVVLHSQTPSKMDWQTACNRLNAVPWEITPQNVSEIWQNVLWAGGADEKGKIITKNRRISSRIIAYMAGEELTYEQKNGLLDAYRALFPEDQRAKKELPPRVDVE